MLYPNICIGGEIFHGERSSHKYIAKVRTKSGKIRYIYRNTINKQEFVDNYNRVNKTKTYKQQLRELQEKYNVVGEDNPSGVLYGDDLKNFSDEYWALQKVKREEEDAKRKKVYDTVNSVLSKIGKMRIG